MKNLILVAGDGDFTDMVLFMKNTKNVNVYIFAWSGSVNHEISKKATQTFFLDDLVKDISKPKKNAKLTNADRLKQE